MHFKFKFFSIVFISCFSSPLFSHLEKEIVVVIPSYNNKDWYQRNLTSLLDQDYSNYSAIYINDCSSDGTSDLVKAFLDQYDSQHRVQLINNGERRGALANHWMAAHMIADDAIVVHLDGDDWFYDSKVLLRINQAYQDPEVWMTYGQFINYPENSIGHCRPTPQEVINNNSWRESLLMRWSHLRTFYAWLFKQIKLDDLMYKNQFFPVACDNAFMYPMLEMAQNHLKFIADICYVYNQDTPLNDYKLRLQQHLATAHYIKKKQHYKPLCRCPESIKNKNNVGMLVFSYDRPLQLFAFLESTNRYIESLGSISVLYRTSNQEFENGYQEVRKAFPAVSFVKQDEHDPHGTFKKQVLSIIDAMREDYLMFGVDDIIVKDTINVSECIDYMQKTHAYGFFLRMGKNITSNYLCDVSLNQDESVPLFLSLDENVCAWQFRFGKREWAYPNTLDLTIYYKNDIEKKLALLSFTTPNTLEGQWYGSSDFSSVGLCFCQSKVVNIPLNVVQEAVHNRMHFNKTKYNFDVKNFLKIFNEGKKIDIDCFYKIENNAPHMDYIPNFIARS